MFKEMMETAQVNGEIMPKVDEIKPDCMLSMMTANMTNNEYPFPHGNYLSVLAIGVNSYVTR